MMLSVMVVGAGAAFSDQSKIKNTEAVDACTALNIIGGYPDGSFKPEGNITRAEATKMICVALNGGKEPAVSTNATPTFSDVRGNANAAWAEGYIESCVAQGIVSGVGAGKFAPNGNVTGVQLAKMLLVALGYKSDLEGFTGNAWATNVNVIATQRGLYKNLEKMDTAAALTRDNAAQMIWNALQATEVEYKYTLDGSNGNLSSKAQVVDKTHREAGTDVDSTLLWDKYDCYVYEGILIGSGEYGEEAGKDKIGLEIQKFEGTSLAKDDYKNGTFKYAKDVTNLVGQYVKVLANKNDEAYGVYAIASENTVVTTTFDKVKQDGTGKIKIDGTSYKYESGAVVKNVVKDASSTALKISEIGDEIAAGDVITFVSHDGDNKFDVAYVNPMVKFGKVTYVGSDKVTAGGVSYDEDDVIPSGLKKGDYVAVYKDLYTGDNKLVKADEVTGKITATKDKAKEVKIGDNWYKVGNTTANKPFADAVIATGDVNQIKKTGDRFTIFSINGIIYYADKESSGSTDTAYVLAAAGTMNSDGDYQVKMLFADGTTKLVATDHAYNNADEGGDLKEKLVTYEVNSDNLYELKEVKNADNHKAGGDSVVTLGKFDKSEKKVVVSASEKYRVSSTAVVYVQYKDGTKTKQKVMTGSELNALGSDFGTSGTAVIDGGLATIVLLQANDYLPGAKATQLYGYITSDVVSEEADGGVKSQSFTVWTSENKSIDVKMKGNTKVTKGDIISFDLTSDNYIEGVKSSNNEETSNHLEIVPGAIKDFKMGDYVTFYNKKDDTVTNIDYEMDDDVKYLFLNTDDTEGVADDTLSKATEASDSSASAKKYYNNAVYVLEGTGANAKIVMIACDVVNQYWKGQTTSVAE